MECKENLQEISAKATTSKLSGHSSEMSIERGAYSRTPVARTIRQWSYDVDRSYDTTYSQS